MLTPVPAAVVASDWAQRVVAPAATAITDARRHEFMAANPDSFLHVTRAYQDDTTGERTPEESAAQNRANLERLLAAGAYRELPPALYLYRLDTGTHRQTAVVGDVPLVAHDHDMVRPHERTRTDREDQLALHLRIVGASASPVGLTHRPIAGLDALLGSVIDRDPLLDFVGIGGLSQTVWRVPTVIAEQITEAFDDQRLYVTDGHHRLVAALRYRDDIDRLHPGAGGPQHSVLGAVFPAEQLHTVAFHRLVDTDWSTDELLAALSRVADLTEVSDPIAAAPTAAGSFGVVHGNRWWRLVPHDTGLDLDVAWLHEQVLAEVMGIVSPRTDPRLHDVPATLGIEAVASRCQHGRVGFLLAATPTESIMNGADRGDILPPKSSYFTPKPRSGVFLVSRRPAI